MDCTHCLQLPAVHVCSSADYVQSISYWTADVCSPLCGLQMSAVQCAMDCRHSQSMCSGLQAWTVVACSPSYSGLQISAVHLFMDCRHCCPCIHGLHAFSAHSSVHALQEAVLQSVRDLESLDADDVADCYTLTRKATQACTDTLLETPFSFPTHVSYACARRL